MEGAAGGAKPTKQAREATRFFDCSVETTYNVLSFLEADSLAAAQATSKTGHWQVPPDHGYKLWHAALSSRRSRTSSSHRRDGFSARGAVARDVAYALAYLKDVEGDEGQIISEMTTAWGYLTRRATMLQADIEIAQGHRVPREGAAREVHALPFALAPAVAEEAEAEAEADEDVGEVHLEEVLNNEEEEEETEEDEDENESEDEEKLAARYQGVPMFLLLVRQAERPILLCEATNWGRFNTGGESTICSYDQSLVGQTFTIGRGTEPLENHLSATMLRPIHKIENDIHEARHPRHRAESLPGHTMDFPIPGPNLELTVLMVDIRPGHGERIAVMSSSIIEAGIDPSFGGVPVNHAARGAHRINEHGWDCAPSVGEQDAYDLSKFNALFAQVGDGPPGHLHVCELYVSIEIQFRRSWTNEFNGRIRQMELKADKGLPSHQKIEDLIGYPTHTNGHFPTAAALEEARQKFFDEEQGACVRRTFYENALTKWR